MTSNTTKLSHYPKNLALAKMTATGALRDMLPWRETALDEIHEAFGGGPWPYGAAPNRPTLEALVSFLHEQRLIAKKSPLDDIFVPAYGRP